MTRWFLSMALLCVASPLLAQTVESVTLVQDSPPAVSASAPKPSATRTRFALGLSADFQDRSDFGSGSRFAFAPGVVGFMYMSSPWRKLLLRPGVRLGFTGLDQAEMPAGLQIDEYDVTIGSEIGLVYNGVVMPAVSFGVEGVVRTIRTQTSSFVDSPSDRDIEFLPGIYAQLGLALPIIHRQVIVEPFWRYEQVFDDPRINWRLGIDVAIALF